MSQQVQNEISILNNDTRIEIVELTIKLIVQELGCKQKNHGKDCNLMDSPEGPWAINFQGDKSFVKVAIDNSTLQLI